MAQKEEILEVRPLRENERIRNLPSALDWPIGAYKPKLSSESGQHRKQPTILIHTIRSAALSITPRRSNLANILPATYDWKSKDFA